MITTKTDATKTAKFGAEIDAKPVFFIPNMLIVNDAGNLLVYGVAK